MGQQFIARWVHTLFVGTVAVLALLYAQAAQAEHPTGWTRVVSLAGADGGVCVEEDAAGVTFRGRLDASDARAGSRSRASWEWRDRDGAWHGLGRTGWVAGGGYSGLGSEWRVDAHRHPTAVRVAVQLGTGGLAIGQRKVARLAACG